MIAGITILIMIVISIILRYSVEGEENMPFELTKIMLISSAEGKQIDENNLNWNMELFQTNDIYINIARNKNYGKREIINKLVLSQIKVTNAPQIGNVKFYRPVENTEDKYNEEYEIKEQIEYKGAEKSNLNNLEVANQGGLILIRCINENLGNYQAQESEEIKHDGTLLSKIGIKNEQIKFKIEFDIEITLESEKTYKAHVAQELPIQNVVQQGVTNEQITDMKEIIFKREQK